MILERMTILYWCFSQKTEMLLFKLHKSKEKRKN